MDYLQSLRLPKPMGIGLDLEGMAVGLLLAFLIGQFVAWVYMYTHAGLSYSRAFVQSLVLLSIIVAMSMMVIGNNIMVAFGLIGALAVIRFRNILKDTRDSAFVFFVLVAGMAVGIGDYMLAIVGSAFFCAILLYLHWADFGSRNLGDGLLRFRIAATSETRAEVHRVLQRHCRRINLLTQRLDSDNMGEMAYRLEMRNPMLSEQLVSEMRGVSGVSDLTFVLQEDDLEV